MFTGLKVLLDSTKIDKERGNETFGNLTGVSRYSDWGDNYKNMFIASRKNGYHIPCLPVLRDITIVDRFFYILIKRVEKKP